MPMCSQAYLTLTFERIIAQNVQHCPFIERRRNGVITLSRIVNCDQFRGDKTTAEWNRFFEFDKKVGAHFAVRPSERCGNPMWAGTCVRPTNTFSSKIPFSAVLMMTCTTARTGIEY
ncbi:unnamed protein product [Nezara viridula]|uniref:Uncharacterized protein n=1 Tax=Nezara viridula TaxID=85310 RepID=A0A9P0MS29_NEZVI|nr:unnamed protein product [Nezara viridula]